MLHSSCDERRRSWKRVRPRAHGRGASPPLRRAAGTPGDGRLSARFALCSARASLSRTGRRAAGALALPPMGRSRACAGARSPRGRASSIRSVRPLSAQAVQAGDSGLASSSTGISTKPKPSRLTRLPVLRNDDGETRQTRQTLAGSASKRREPGSLRKSSFPVSRLCPCLWAAHARQPAPAPAAPGTSSSREALPKLAPRPHAGEAVALEATASAATSHSRPPRGPPRSERSGRSRLVHRQCPPTDLPTVQLGNGGLCLGLEWASRQNQTLDWPVSRSMMMVADSTWP